ncbi:alpha/beta hydrolase [Thermopolyspora sp. NPDC052614]|uniref:alpha/beta hydrolase n=1 Tax=Thermopolyspora sp. NPDC052614 TaxID=3155682 RepID=UPI003442042F
MRTAMTVGSLALAAVMLSGLSAPAQASDVSARTGPDPSVTATATPNPGFNDNLSGVYIRTVRYGRHLRQRMDVWYRRDGVARPAVFIIHGGWWNSGDKHSMNSIVRGYAELGYTVFNINYRWSQDAPWPAQRVDALDAIFTARRHAQLFGFDPNRYAIVGFSAGGHIAASVGTYRDGLPGLRAVVGVSPVISPMTAFVDGDLGAAPEQQRLRKAAVALAGGCLPTQARCSKMWASMEVPWHASRGDAPMLTVHSQDEFVPPYHSELLKEQLARAGVAMNIRVVPGFQHSSALYREPGVAEGIQEWLATRLGRIPSAGGGQQ